MDRMAVEPNDTSSEASYFEQEPVSGAVLLDRELLHREACEAKGNILTGCPELDNHVLLGGLARGRVVGLTAEEEAFGLILGLQTLARLLVRERVGDASRRPSAIIITTLSHAELLPPLRNVIKGQVDSLNGVQDARSRMKSALERISISRVFDFDGLREALDELDPPIEADQPKEQVTVLRQQPDETLEQPHLPTANRSEPEIRDSEDEDESSSAESPAVHQEHCHQEKLEVPEPHQLKRPGAPRPQHYLIPDIILITSMTALITSLYTTRDRKHAHRMLRHLSSRLRYLSRSPSHGGPLFILLNSTTSKPPLREEPRAHGEDYHHHAHQQQQSQRGADNPPSSARSTPLSQSSPLSSSPPSPSDQAMPPINRDVTLRLRREGQDSHSAISSVFNPSPPDPGEERGEVDEYGYARHPNPGFALLARLSRRNKPFFGLRFDALVDVHLLATRVPRTDGDAEVYFAVLGRDGKGEVVRGGGDDGPGLVWVVEVLADRVGVWVEDPEGDGGLEGEEQGMDDRGKRVEGRMGRRFDREQRWAGVEVTENDGGVRVVDVAGRRAIQVER